MAERISAGLKLADSQKEGLSEAFKQSIQLINRQQSDLEAHFDSIQKFIEERCEELDSKEKQLGSAELLLEQRSKELESREKGFDVARLEYEKKSTELLDLQERVNGWLLEVESREKELESLQQTVERRLAELQSKEKLFELRCKEVESREKRCEELAKQLELREAGSGKVHTMTKVKVEQEEVWASNDGSNSVAASLQFSVTMDGRCLQIFLNEHVDDHDSMRDEVFLALRMSADPGKLVLDALEGFYPPHLKKGDKEFQTRVVQRSCTLLLAQLMRISPEIRRCVKEEAAKVAVDWKARLAAKFAVDRKIELEVQDENSLEVLGFLHLVGIYGLVTGFDSDEVLKLLETIAWHQEAPELFGVLGFVDTVPGVVQGLIGRRQNPAAIRLIHAFKLVREFPPGPILEDYFKYWKKISDEIFESKNFTGEQIRIGIDALRAVIKCIEDHKLGTKIVPMEVEKHILLLTEKAESKCATPSETNPQPQQQSGKKFSAPIVSAHEDQDQRQQSGKKCSALIVSAHKDQDQRQQSGKNCSAAIVSAHKDQDQRQQSGKKYSASNVSAHKDQDQPQSRSRKKRKKKRRGASTVSSPVIQHQLQSGQQKSGKKNGVPTVSGPVIQHQQQSGSQQKGEKKHGIPVSAPVIQHQQQSGPQKKSEKKQGAPTGSATMTQQQEQSRPQQKNEKKRDAPIVSGPKVQQQQRLQQRSEKKSGALTMSTAEQSVNKRRRTVVSADAPNASIGSAVRSIPSPHPYSTSGFAGQGAPYFVPPLPGPYELAGFVDPHIIPYPERSLPYMPRDAPRESFYGGTAGYYDGGPSEYYAEYARIPSDGYDMTPLFRHPSMLFP